MAFMNINLTPELYTVFNMLLTSHFDVLPFNDEITNSVMNTENNNGDNAEIPFN